MNNILKISFMTVLFFSMTACASIKEGWEHDKHKGETPSTGIYNVPGYGVVGAVNTDYPNAAAKIVFGKELGDK